MKFGRPKDVGDGEWHTFYPDIGAGEYVLDLKVRPIDGKTYERIEDRYKKRKRKQGRRGSTVVEAVPESKKRALHADLIDHAVADWGGDGKVEVKGDGTEKPRPHGPTVDFCTRCNQADLGEPGRRCWVKVCQCDGSQELVERPMPLTREFKFFVLDHTPGLYEEVLEVASELASTIQGAGEVSAEDAENLSSTPGSEPPTRSETAAGGP